MRIQGTFLVAVVACGGRVSPLAIPPPPADAGVEATARDAATPDAGAADADAADAPDATIVYPPGSWCGDTFPYGITMCDDFDLLGTPRPEWITSGSGLAVVDSPNVSAPHALHVLAAPGTTSSLSFRTQAVAIETKIEAEIEVVADGTSSAGGDPVVVAVDCDGGQSLGIAIVPGTSSARCFDSGFSPPTSTELPFARGVWHEVGLKLSVNQDGTYNPTCVVDGADYGPLQAVQVSAAVGNMTWVVGVDATTTQAVEAYYDNVADAAME